MSAQSNLTGSVFGRLGFGWFCFDGLGFWQIRVWLVLL